jgi:surface antigen
MMQRTKALAGSLAVVVALALSSVGARAEDYWQCAAFARVFSGIQIVGDAWTWWEKANGHYLKGFTPQAGAVLVFKPQGAMRLGHVAVVSQVLTDRIIQVTHANWSRIDGTRGKIEQNVTVVDVSPDGDWSQVKVWYDPVRDLGTTSYATYGFIYKTTVENAGAAAKNAALTVAQTTMGQMASAVSSPSATPVQAFAKDSTDKIAALIQSVMGGSSNDASSSH